MRALTLLLATCLPCAADTGVNDQTVSQSFQLTASVVNGCLLGTGATDATSFGSLSFGALTTLDQPVDISGTSGQGAVVLRCTPGTSVSVALDAGQHASMVSGGRILAQGTDQLRYQLYQDAARNIVWGDGSNGGAPLSLTFTSTDSATYPVHARLFATAPLPPAGLYTDVVVVTVNY